LAQVERPHERSKLFEWLLAHHDEVISASGGRRMEWRRLCGQFESAGLVDRDGKAVNATTARKTWQRVRKGKASIDALRAAERAERDRRAATNPRREMPSQFRKGDYGPPLVTMSATKPELQATAVEQAKRGFQLSTMEGVVVTKAGRVVELEEGGGLRLRRGRHDRRNHEPCGCLAQQTAAQRHRSSPDQRRDGGDVRKSWTKERKAMNIHAIDEVKDADQECRRVLAIRFGQGRTGGTTFLDFLIQRARRAGRTVTIADGDRKKPTLASLYPPTEPGGALQPRGKDIGDMMEWVTEITS
jgi:hypothetical protein